MAMAGVYRLDSGQVGEPAADFPRRELAGRSICGAKQPNSRTTDDSRANSASPFFHGSAAHPAVSERVLEGSGRAEEGLAEAARRLDVGVLVELVEARDHDQIGRRIEVERDPLH